MVLADYPYTYSTHRGRYWRFRRGGEDVALPGKPGETTFLKAYAEQMEKHDRRDAAVPPDSKTFAWLIDAYQKSPEFKGLSEATQLDYAGKDGKGGTLAIINQFLGDEPYRLTTRAMIKAVRDKFASNPRKANKIKQMASRLYSWADENTYVPEGHNPTKGLKRLKAQGGEKEYVVWSAQEFDHFYAAAIEPMQTATMLARYTGQRARDIVKMVWTDFQGDMIRVRQSKTGAPLIIHCHTKLRTYLDDLRRRQDGGKRRGALILTSVAGKPYSRVGLSAAINREVRKIAGMPIDRSIHGLRYMAGSDMEEAGCTIGEIEAVLGHETFKMAMKYATQRLRSKAAIAKLEGA